MWCAIEIRSQQMVRPLPGIRSSDICGEQTCFDNCNESARVTVSVQTTPELPTRLWIQIREYLTCWADQRNDGVGVRNRCWQQSRGECRLQPFNATSKIRMSDEHRQFIVRASIRLDLWRRVTSVCRMVSGDCPNRDVPVFITAGDAWSPFTPRRLLTQPEHNPFVPQSLPLPTSPRDHSLKVLIGFSKVM